MNISKIIILLYFLTISYYITIGNDRDLFNIVCYFIIATTILIVSRLFVSLRNFFDV
jgi:hypothetical protein